MKVFKIYYENVSGVETTKVLAKSRRSLKLPFDNTDSVIKIVDITEDFKIKLKSDIETIIEKTSEENVQDIILALTSIELF